MERYFDIISNLSNRAFRLSEEDVSPPMFHREMGKILSSCGLGRKIVKWTFSFFPALPLCVILGQQIYQVDHGGSVCKRQVLVLLIILNFL